MWWCLPHRFVSAALWGDQRHDLLMVAFFFKARGGLIIGCGGSGGNQLNTSIGPDRRHDKVVDGGRFGSAGCRDDLGAGLIVVRDVS